MAKHALCIGINDYPGTGSDLAGCVNDALDWSHELTAQRFSTLTLLDSQASRESILAEVQKLVESVDYRDIGVITFSGHGTWVPDVDRDELDRRDEAICPWDIHTTGPILDDELYRIFISRPHGARLVFISDSCFSGTLQRLAAPLSEAPDLRQIRFLPPSLWIDPDEHELMAAAEAVEFIQPRGKPRSSALVMAGCKDTEVAYDAWFDGRANGAYTFAALKALRELPAKSTYNDWQSEIRRYLPSRDYMQTPQLDGTATQRRWATLESTKAGD